MLSKIDPEEKGTSSLRASLQNEAEFWSAFSEIELIGALRSRFKVEIHPEVREAKQEGESPPKVDIEVKNTTRVLIEVITPEIRHELRHSSKALVGKNRVRGKLVYETQKHLQAFQKDSQCHS